MKSEASNDAAKDLLLDSPLGREISEVSGDALQYEFRFANEVGKFDSETVREGPLSPMGDRVTE